MVESLFRAVTNSDSDKKPSRGRRLRALCASTGVPHQIAMEPVCTRIRRAAAVLRWLAQSRTMPLEPQNVLSAGIAVFTQALQGAIRRYAGSSRFPERRWELLLGKSHFALGGEGDLVVGARKLAELGPGDFAPLDKAIPELAGKGTSVGAGPPASVEVKAGSPSEDASLVPAPPAQAPDANDDAAGPSAAGDAAATGGSIPAKSSRTDVNRAADAPSAA